MWLVRKNAANRYIIMSELGKKTQNSICSYKKIKIDISQHPLRFPRIEKFNDKCRFTGLLTKIKSLNTTLNTKKYVNNILMTPNRKEDTSGDKKLHYFTLRNLAAEHNEYLQMYKIVELQNLRIKRLRKKN